VLCPLLGEFCSPGCASASSTSSTRTFMRTHSRVNSLALTTPAVPLGVSVLFSVRRATSSPWIDVGQGRPFIYPIGALASPFAHRVMLCPTAVPPRRRWASFRSPLLMSKTSNAWWSCQNPSGGLAAHAHPHVGLAAVDPAGSRVANHPRPSHMVDRAAPHHTGSRRILCAVLSQASHTTV
jgi:hypothetical protein